MTAAIVLNLIFATAIGITLVGLLAWAIATQSRDDGPIQVQDLARQTLACRRRSDRRAHVDGPLAGHSKRHRGQRGSVTA